MQDKVPEPVAVGLRPDIEKFVKKPKVKKAAKRATKREKVVVSGVETADNEEAAELDAQAEEQEAQETDKPEPDAVEPDTAEAGNEEPQTKQKRGKKRRSRAGSLKLESQVKVIETPGTLHVAHATCSLSQLQGQQWYVHTLYTYIYIYISLSSLALQRA